MMSPKNADNTPDLFNTMSSPNAPPTSLPVTQRPRIVSSAKNSFLQEIENKKKAEAEAFEKARRNRISSISNVITTASVTARTTSFGQSLSAKLALPRDAPSTSVAARTASFGQSVKFRAPVTCGTPTSEVISPIPVRTRNVSFLGSGSSLAKSEDKLEVQDISNTRLSVPAPCSASSEESKDVSVQLSYSKASETNATSPTGPDTKEEINTKFEDFEDEKATSIVEEPSKVKESPCVLPVEASLESIEPQKIEEPTPPGSTSSTAKTVKAQHIKQEATTPNAAESAVEVAQPEIMEDKYTTLATLESQLESVEAEKVEHKSAFPNTPESPIDMGQAEKLVEEVIAVALPESLLKTVKAEEIKKPATTTVIAESTPEAIEDVVTTTAPKLVLETDEVNKVKEKPLTSNTPNSPVKSIKMQEIEENSPACITPESLLETLQVKIVDEEPSVGPTPRPLSQSIHIQEIEEEPIISATSVAPVELSHSHENGNELLIPEVPPNTPTLLPQLVYSRNPSFLEIDSPPPVIAPPFPSSENVDTLCLLMRPAKKAASIHNEPAIIEEPKIHRSETFALPLASTFRHVSNQSMSRILKRSCSQCLRCAYLISENEKRFYDQEIFSCGKCKRSLVKVTDEASTNTEENKENIPPLSPFIASGFAGLMTNEDPNFNAWATEETSINNGAHENCRVDSDQDVWGSIAMGKIRGRGGAIEKTWGDVEEDEESSEYTDSDLPQMGLRPRPAH